MNDADFRILKHMLDKIIRIEEKLDKLLEAKKPKARKANKTDYSPDFNQAWELYPRRTGTNSKSKAYSAWCARRAENSIEWASMCAGTYRYREFCDETGKTGTEYAMMASTFFGPDKHYENDWTVPTQADTLPKVNEELEAFAKNTGMESPLPYTGEGWAQYRIRIQEAIK